VQHLPEHGVIGKSDILQSLIEADNRAPIHFVVLSVAAVHPDDSRFIAIGVAVRARATESLAPVGRESLSMLGVEPVAEGMGDNLVSHNPTMPGTGKTAHALLAARRLEDSFHAPMIANVWCRGNGVAKNVFLSVIEQLPRNSW
jgi:hypothetical protein